MAIEAQNCGLEEAYVESEGFTFDSCLASTDLKHLSSTSFEVKELEELPEQWRRSKVAWLCKELPSHKPATLIRILNAQKKWITQEDCTYISVHCMRVRENEAGFRVRYLNDILYLSFVSRHSCSLSNLYRYSSDHSKKQYHF